MPNITFKGNDEEKPALGQLINVFIGGFTTIGAVWKIVKETGEVIAKARVKKDYSKDEGFTDVPLFIDPRRVIDRDGGDSFNSGKGFFGLRVEKTNDDEVLY